MRCIFAVAAAVEMARCLNYQPYMLPNEATFAVFVPIQHHNGDPWRIIYIVPLAIVGEASGSPLGTGFT